MQLDDPMPVENMQLDDPMPVENMQPDEPMPVENRPEMEPMDDGPTPLGPEAVEEFRVRLCRYQNAEDVHVGSWADQETPFTIAEWQAAETRVNATKLKLNPHDQERAIRNIMRQNRNLDAVEEAEDADHPRRRKG